LEEEEAFATDPEKAEQGEENTGNTTPGGAETDTGSEEIGPERFANPSEPG